MNLDKVQFMQLLWALKGTKLYGEIIHLEAIEARRSHNKGIRLNTLKGFEKENLSKANQLNLRLFTDLAKKEVEIAQFNRHLLPFNHRGGIQLAHEDAENLPFKNAQDYRFWIER